MYSCPDCGCRNKDDANFCQECGLRLTPTICPDCHVPIKGKAKFCPSCGAKIESIQKEISEKTAPIPYKGITIEFAHSSSQNYYFALEHAQKNSSFFQNGVGRKTLYRVTYQKEDTDELIKMVDLLQWVRNKKVYVDGESQMWDDVFILLLVMNKE